MKKIIILSLFFGLHLLVKAQMTTPAYTKKLNVAVFIYPGVGLGDLNGPADIFTKASGLTKGQYHVYTVALTKGIIATQGGTIQITPDFTAGNMPKPDILVIPGGSIGLLDSMTHDTKVISFIRKYRDSANVVMSVCTGAYLLGKAGVLDHHKATTHYFNADDFQQQFPGLTIVKDVRYVDEGNVLTTSGVTSGIDGALHLVAKYSGDAVEKMLERAIQYTMHEQEKWPEFVNGMKFDRARREKMGILIPAGKDK